MRRLEQRRLSLLCAAALLAPSLALAQTPPEPVEVVVTGSRTKEDAQRATVRTKVVSNRTAERRGARNVGEALLDEAALDSRPARNGVGGGFSIRGLDAEHVLVLEDGVPVAGRSAGAVDLDELSIQGLDRIEYVLGPMSSLYGSDAIGGVINLVTGPPGHEGASATTRLEARQRTQIFGAASGSFQRRDSWVTVDASLSNRAGVPFQNGPDLLVPELRTTMIGLRAGTTLFERVDLKLKTRFARDLRAGVYSQTESIGGEPRNFVNDSNLKNDRYQLTFLETLHLSSKSQLDFTFSRQWYDADLDVSLRNSPSRETGQGRERTQRLEAVATIPESTRTWLFGVGTENQKLTETRTDVEFRNQRLETVTADAMKPAFRTDAWSFAQLDWKLLPDLSLVVGGRGELHDPYGNVLVPRASLAAHPSDALTLRASAARGYRTPSAKEIGFQFDHCSLGYSVNGNPELEPERSWGLTADTTVRPLDVLGFEASVFGNWLTDKIDVAIGEGPGLCRTGTNYVMVNIGKARTAGGDIAARFNPTPWSTLRAEYAYLWTRDDTTGNPLNESPEHTVKASLDIDLGRRFDALVRFRYVSTAFYENGEEDLETPAYALLAARVAYSPIHPLSVYVGLENITNTQSEPFAIADPRPQLGRTLYVGITSELSNDED